ncbi:hypothetical protein EON67_07720 [archaeon]|nr:MAG: hypothetical protein EON67_07720 [archaeon]
MDDVWMPALCRSGPWQRALLYAAMWDGTRRARSRGVELTPCARSWRPCALRVLVSSSTSVRVCAYVCKPPHPLLRVRARAHARLVQTLRVRAMAAKHSFTKEQVAEYLEHFNEFDEDGSGSIEAAELKSVLDKCGVETTDTQVQEMIKEADRDGSGSLEFEEFLLLMWRLQSGPSEKEVRNEAFTVRAHSRHGTHTRASQHTRLTTAVPAVVHASHCV